MPPNLTRKSPTGHCSVVRQPEGEVAVPTVCRAIDVGYLGLLSTALLTDERHQMSCTTEIDRLIYAIFVATV